MVSRWICVVPVVRNAGFPNGDDRKLVRMAEAGNLPTIYDAEQDMCQSPLPESRVNENGYSHGKNKATPLILA
jgi:hypothetical protein